jgi:glycerophosphoryl diester phosphodiesterase
MMKKMFFFAIAGVVTLTACKTSKTSKNDSLATTLTALDLPAFNKEGHRGTRGLMPENTIPAMYKGIDLGANSVEVDVVYSKDRKVVISHDLYFNHEITTTPEGKYFDKKEAQQRLLYNMTYDSIRKYDVGMKPYPEFPQQQKMPAYKPLLSELIDSVRAYAKAQGRKVILNIELKTNKSWDVVKTPPVDEFVDGVMAVVNAASFKNECYLQSFDKRPLQILHKKYPYIVTALLVSGEDKKTLQQLDEMGYQPEMYSPHFSLVTPELVTDCHKRGIKLIPWTVNTLEDMKRLKALGVDGIITDYPNFFAQL